VYIYVVTSYRRYHIVGEVASEQTYELPQHNRALLTIAR